MLRALRVLAAIVLVVLLCASGCDEKPRKNGTSPSTSPSGSVSVTPTTPTTPVTASTPTTATTPTTSGSVFLTTYVKRTGYTVTHDGQPIDKGGLLALGWVVNPGLGNAQWSDPALGSMSVEWEVPDSTGIDYFDSQFWGSVTGPNIAMNPTMSTSAPFTGGPVEATAYSTGGQKAETPTVRLSIRATPQPAGTTAQVHMNLGWPQPVLITYNYVYQ